MSTTASPALGELGNAVGSDASGVAALSEECAYAVVESRWGSVVADTLDHGVTQMRGA
jgi:hypothetical protein